MHSISPLAVLLTSFGKMTFAWRFILNYNILLLLTRSYQKPIVGSVSVLCSQNFTMTLNLQPTTGLTYAISIANWIFRISLLENIFCLSLLILHYQYSITIL